VLLVVAAGCGTTHGTATVWITQNEGHRVLLQTKVPAGITGMQALARVAKIGTRYGGRFVESIDGISGSLSRERDWFWFVNGIQGDRSAAEYRLRNGDVEWWDYRYWGGGKESVPVVVGSFPEPFLHGYGGKVRPAVVVGSGAGARAIARLLHARVMHTPPRDANVFRIVGSAGRHLTARTRPGGTVEFDFSGDARQLALNPVLVRFRYALP
jgi:hypothetical protein